MNDTSTSRRRISAIAIALSAAIVAPMANAAEGDGWDWMVAPYLWAVSIDTDLQRTVPPEGGFSTDTGFDEVLEKFDGVFQLHVEGQEEQWGLFTDITYLGLSDEHDYPRFHTESDLDARLFELAAVWNPGPGRYRGLDVFAGLRYIDVDLGVQFDPANPLFNTSSFEGSESFNDFMIGARYTWDMSERWAVTLRGDGSFGDTNGTWNASAVASLQMTHGAWLFGYRYLSGELDVGNSRMDVTLNGPMIGYGFAF